MSRLKLLGGAHVEDEPGVVNRISSRRHPLALLALLATAPSRTSSRGKLVGLLWPEAPEKTARNRLTTCVHELRRELGDDVVVSVGADLRLDTAALDCDVRVFEHALDVGNYAEAVTLYDGPFLDGFEFGGSPEFEHRVDRERSRFQRAYHRALEALADEAERRGDAEAAAGWWRERAAEDPHDSRVARRLMEALAAAGNRAEALRVAEAHTQLLEEEFRTEPDPEFARLRETLQLAPGPLVPEAEIASLPSAAVPPRDVRVRSIAVLPFENLSRTADAEPFAAGLHDDLLTELSRIPGLTVISRTSVQRYRGSDKSLREIASELGAGTVVEGAVQAAGGRVRLNVQLIDARTDVHRWVERYDRELSTDSIFDIQTELARKIATTLRAELAPGERERSSREPTEDLQAYQLYIQGRGLLDQRTRLEMYRSIDYFQRAIERDPDYALAWSGLADALSLLEFYDYPPPVSAPDPMSAARRAVELAPASGPARASLGIILSIRQDGPAALRELEAAAELAPSYAESHVWLAWVHLLRGCPDQALEPARRAVELDPLGPALRAYLAETWLALGEPREALGEARRARQIRPAYGLAHFMEGLVLYHLGRLPEAESALEAALALVPPGGTPSHAEVHAALAIVRAAGGDPAGARQRLAPIREAGDVFCSGLVHAALGEVDQSFAAFERVRDWRSFSTEHFRYFFPEVLGPLRNDARYRHILSELDRRWGRDADRRPAGST
jgi:TolB-like protein/DNA-binding SARP family transcriptional activator/Flp pilus assembly protein TadD